MRAHVRLERLCYHAAMRDEAGLERETAKPQGKKRVLLLLSAHTYRGGAFLEAAESLGLEVVRGVDVPEELAEQWRVPLGLEFDDLERSTEKVVEYARQRPLDAIISVDDSASLLAARASAALGLPHNSPQAALAARDKYEMRKLLAAGSVPVPQFMRYSLLQDPKVLASRVSYPCVVKPLRLSGSRGVIRADGPEEFATAFERLKRLLLSEGNVPDTTNVLVEEFIPGVEVALEGLLTNGDLQVLALFDKPDPLDGPYFEETLYVTPSRLPDVARAAIAACTSQAAEALGLCEGPVHAELRLNSKGPWIVEIAGRSIGGLCSTVLRFGAGVRLEELILRHAVDLEIEGLDRERKAAGVMMIPIPKAGLLTGVEGVEEAKAVPGIEGVEITARLRQPLVPLPEGASYLGFIFARADDPASAEKALRQAHSRLRFKIQAQIPILHTSRVEVSPVKQ